MNKKIVSWVVKILGRDWSLTLIKSLVFGKDLARNVIDFSQKINELINKSIKCPKIKSKLCNLLNIQKSKTIKLMQIGKSKWTRSDLKSKLKEFSELYKNRPIKDNYWGMKSPHMFSAWFAIQFLKPKCIIESGTWKGQGTWFFEKAAPNAKIHSIDIDLGLREYISEKVIYHNIDFFDIDWNDIPKEKTLCFFDDHQDVVERVKFAKENGFKMLMFEDNYPPCQGDCYSLKKAFATKGGEDADYLKDVLKVYYEFPPVLKSERTRWGDKWDDKKYPTPEPLYKNVENEYLQVYFDELIHYTWICYVELK